MPEILGKTLGYVLHVYLLALLRLNVKFAAEWSNMLQQQTQTTRAEFQSAGNSAVHTLISHELQRYSLLNMITKTHKRGRESRKYTFDVTDYAYLYFSFSDNFSKLCLRYVHKVKRRWERVIRKLSASTCSRNLVSVLIHVLYLQCELRQRFISFVL